MLTGRKGLVLGVANKRSIAIACARSCAERGALVGLTYQGERFEEGARQLAGTLPGPSATAPLFACDVTKDEDLANLVEHFWNKTAKTFLLDPADPLLAACLVTHSGAIVHPHLKPS